MSAAYAFVSLIVEGAIWLAAFTCVFRSVGKLREEDFVRVMRGLSPLWAVSSIALAMAYLAEVFIAVYSANEYEGVVFLEQGNVTRQRSLSLQILVFVVPNLLPAILFIGKARPRKEIVYSITGICFISLIVVRRFS